MEGLATPFKSIAQGIVKLGEHFSKVLDFLNPLSDNFILKKLWEFLTTIIDYLNPFSENFFGLKLIEFIGDLLEYLFIPKEDLFGSLRTEIENKFQFTKQISNLFETLLNDFNYGDNIPTFNITYEGVTANIIDFSPYLEYRSWLHTIILGISWFIFIRKTFNKIPFLIGGI